MMDFGIMFPHGWLNRKGLDPFAFSGDDTMSHKFANLKYYVADKLTTRDIQSLANGIGTIGSLVVGLVDVDKEAGIGRIDEKTVCVWRMDGKRITIHAGEGMIASVSAVPDPSYPGQRFTISGPLDSEIRSNLEIDIDGKTRLNMGEIDG